LDIRFAQYYDLLSQDAFIFKKFGSSIAR